VRSALLGRLGVDANDGELVTPDSDHPALRTPVDGPVCEANIDRLGLVIFRIERPAGNRDGFIGSAEDVAVYGDPRIGCRPDEKQAAIVGKLLRILRRAVDGDPGLERR